MFTACAFQQSSTVTLLASSGPARRAGLELGDQIWEVNRRNVRGDSVTDVENMIASIKSDVVLLVISTLRSVELSTEKVVS